MFLSTNREIMAPGKIKKRGDGDIADSAAELIKSDKLSPKFLKAKLKDESKSSSQEFVQSKEAETVSEVKAKNQNKRKRNEQGKQDGNGKINAPKDVISHHRNEAKKISEDKCEERKRREQKCGESIGGMIFMCNAKTKPDCFHYLVMGVSTSRHELVMHIKPGLKLFLFDFDLKLMYGIYEASSTGGMKLEPAAFAGAFPVQVRFKIYKDCLPLPESIFKKAIKDSYDEKTHKFKTELTFEQVKRLTELFRPAPWLHSNGRSSRPELVPVPIVQPPSLSTSPNQETHREQVYREQYGNAALVQKEPGHGDIYFLSEKEYQTYGLKGFQDPPSRHTPTLETNRAFEDSMKDVCNAYDDSTTSLVNRYLPLPGTMATPTVPYYLTRRGAYVNGSSYTRGAKDHLGRLNPQGAMSHSSNASHALSDYNRNYHRLGGEPDVTSLTVSSHYSFEGPHLSRR